ncbi:MAG: class I tRNA ligase family protein, partial [Candidatus Micrarchaeota archaeon]|nr:class I tRNA ligase family protein [Candidatus Micrarchaeota archaeon]
NDQRHTAIAHITNHLSFFVFAHTACFASEHWPKAITLNELVIAEGRKMSKSKGNVVSLNDIAQNTGADAFRLYAVSTADLGATLDFRARDIDALKKRMNKLYAIWDEFAPAKPPAAASPDTPIARWIRSKFHGIAQKCTADLEAMRLRDYSQTAFFETINVVEHFLNRANDAEKAAVFSELIRPWIALLCPLIPHAAEEYWQKTGGTGFASHAAWPKLPDAFKDANAERQEDYLMTVASDVRTVLKLVKGKPVGLTVILASQSKQKEYAAMLANQTPDAIPDGTFMASFVKKRFFELREKELPNESEALAAGKAFLESVFGLPVTVVSQEQTDNPRKDKALPGKPAIHVE